jgi:hypothetical protein
MLSRRLKGKWSFRRRRGFHSTLSVSFTLRHHSTSLSIGIIFHSYLLVPMGEKVKRALKRLRFWRLVPKGEKYQAHSKRTAPPPISIFLRLLNWYLNVFNLIQFGIYKIGKTFLNTKRRISFRGSFVFSQRKSI